MSDSPFPPPSPERRRLSKSPGGPVWPGVGLAQTERTVQVNARQSPRRSTRLLLAATLASLLVTLFAGYGARISLVDANDWIRHTDEVKLALGQCKLAVAMQDLQALQDAETRLRSLTADNPHEQQNVARASALVDEGAFGEADVVFTSMERIEDGLLAARLRREARARTATLLATLLAGLLTAGFAAGWLAFAQAQVKEQKRRRTASTSTRSASTALSTRSPTTRSSCSTRAGTSPRGTLVPRRQRATEPTRSSASTSPSSIRPRIAPQVGPPSSSRPSVVTDASKTRAGACEETAPASGRTSSSPRCATATATSRDSQRSRGI